MKELKEKYMKKVCKDFLWINSDWKVVLENDKIKATLWVCWATRWLENLDLKLWTYWPFVLWNSKFTIKDTNTIKTVKDFYNELKNFLDWTKYIHIMLNHQWFEDLDWNEIILEETNDEIEKCQSNNKNYYVNKKEKDLEEYIVNNIKQKRRSNYRKILRTYENNEKYELFIKYAEDISEIKEFEDFCYEWFINNKFWEQNYMKADHVRMFFRFCFEEWYKVLLLKIYDKEANKLIWCEYALEIWDTLYCLFWYEDTGNYDWLWIFLVMKEIEFMLKSWHLNKCDYSSWDVWYKERMWMKSHPCYFTYLKNSNV